MTLPWIIAGTAAGLVAGPWIRTVVFRRSVEYGDPLRHACPACSSEIVPERGIWHLPLSALGRCRSCGTRIGPYPGSVELAGGLAIAVVIGQSATGWEAAALAWLCLVGVALACIDLAVRRLPETLNIVAFVGTMVLLVIAALAGHDPWRAGRAAAAAAILAGGYLLIALARPGGLGFGDAELAASVGAALGWFGWRTLVEGTFMAFVFCTAYIGILWVAHGYQTARKVPFGPFMLLGALVAIAI